MNTQLASSPITARARTRARRRAEQRRGGGEPLELLALDAVRAAEAHDRSRRRRPARTPTHSAKPTQLTKPASTRRRAGCRPTGSSRAGRAGRRCRRTEHAAGPAPPSPRSASAASAAGRWGTAAAGDEHEEHRGNPHRVREPQTELGDAARVAADRRARRGSRTDSPTKLHVSAAGMAPSIQPIGLRGACEATNAPTTANADQPRGVEQPDERRPSSAARSRGEDRGPVRAGVPDRPTRANAAAASVSAHIPQAGRASRWLMLRILSDRRPESVTSLPAPRGPRGGRPRGRRG